MKVGVLWSLVSKLKEEFLKLEEDAIGQETQVDSRNWKKEENRFSPRASRPANILVLAQ